MRLDRNLNSAGKGKYALLNLRTNQIQWGNTPEDDFFVIKLKDEFAEEALIAYAEAVEKRANEIGGHLGLDLHEYAGEIFELASRAALNPCKKLPD